MRNKQNTSQAPHIPTPIQKAPVVGEIIIDKDKELWERNIQRKHFGKFLAKQKQIKHHWGILETQKNTISSA